MSQSSDEGDARGCLFLFGILIVAICIGSIYTQLAGWMTLGLGLLFAALLPGPRS